MFHRVLILVWSLCFWGALAVNEDSTESYSLRLVGGDGQCRGELQIQRSGQDWTGVHPWMFSLWFGHRACAELDCGSALTVDRKTVPYTAVVRLHHVFCNDTSLSHCFRSGTYRSDEILELNCSDSVRLVEGRSLCSGSLQIRDQSQSWTSVCEGALDPRGAVVLCRELGCGAPLHLGELSPLGPTFHCEGHESALMDCPRNQTRTDPGSCPGPTLNLTCSDPVRLVGGASRCEGTVQVEHRGEWRRVLSFTDLWELEAAGAVCRGLDCGSAVSTEERWGPDYNDTWGVRPDCVRERAAVKDCIFTGFSGRNVDLQLMCLGH